MTDYPQRIDIELTNACQLHCIMCPRGIGKMARPVGFMEWDLLTKIIDESEGKSLSVWAHVFGESLLHPNVIDVLSLLREHVAWLGLSTNAVSLDAAMSKKLIALNLDTLILSLDSMRKKVYESRRVGAIFETTLQNIADCLRARRDDKASKTTILLQLIDFDGSKKDVRKARQRYSRRLRGIGKISVKTFTTYGGTVPAYSAKVKPTVGDPCEMADYAMTILWNGDATICCHDVNGDYVFGNVNDSGIYELWNSPERRLYHSNIFERNFDNMPMCRNCIGIKLT